MKKIIYAFLLLFSFLSFSSAYAVDNFTNPQDLGNGSTPTGTTGGSNGAYKEVVPHV